MPGSWSELDDRAEGRAIANIFNTTRSKSQVHKIDSTYQVSSQLGQHGRSEWKDLSTFCIIYSKSESNNCQ